ncbi:MAG: sulfatase-like hydrolase/transferase [Planctomycetota bacterium]|nr:sulfatase-like hydrolase/transferase [Planctomycetota bacterium]
MDAHKAIVLLAASGLVACGGGEEQPRHPRSALLITLDTMRADALTYLGGHEGITPNLDALAAESVVYEAARTVAPTTMPAHASMLTGLYPPRHTVRDNGLNALPSSAWTLAEAAQEQGLETAAFVASIVLADGCGLAQGFDHYDQPPPPALLMPGQYMRRAAYQVRDAFNLWLRRRDASKPFFAWVHLYDPHRPYNPDNPMRKRDPGDGYLAEVAQVDHAVGRMLEELEGLGLLDETLILVVADHGEGRGEHGEVRHSTLIYESTMLVPMILRYPDGYRAGERSTEIVSVVDVYPTIAEALELRGHSMVDGLSLFGRRVDDDRGVYMESYHGFYAYGWSPLAGWADRNGKYIHASEAEFYAASDVRELENRIDAMGVEIDSYRQAIDRVVRGPALERDADDVAAASMLAHLQQLGYTGAGPGDDPTPHPLAETNRPSPRSRIEAMQRFLSTEELLGRKPDPERAAEILRDIVAENPHNVSAWHQLSSACIRLELYEEAVTAARKALEHGRAWYGPRNNLGIALHRLGRDDEALEQLVLATEEAPALTAAVDTIIQILEDAGRSEEANEVRARRGQGR